MSSPHTLVALLVVLVGCGELAGLGPRRSLERPSAAGGGGVPGVGGGQGGDGGTTLGPDQCTPDGAARWLKAFGGPGTERVNSLAPDGDGGFYLSADFAGTLDFGAGPLEGPGSSDFFIARFGPSGVPLWQRAFGSPFPDERGPRLALHPRGVVVCGTNQTILAFGEETHTTTGVDLYVVLLSPEGEALWEFWLEGPDHAWCWAHPVVDPTTGDVFVPGWYEGAITLQGESIPEAGDGDAFLLRLDEEDGSVVAHRTFGAPGQEPIRSLLVLPEGDVVMASQVDGNVDIGQGPLVHEGRDMLLARFDANLDPVWGHVFDSPGVAVPGPMALSSSGELVVAGSLDGTADLGAGPITDSLGGFVARLSTTDGYATASRDLDGFNGPAVVLEDPAGNIVIAGQYAHTLTLGGVDLSAGQVGSIQGDHVAVSLTPSFVTVRWMQLGANNVPGEAFSAGILTEKGTLLLGGNFYETMNIEGCTEQTSVGDSDLFFLERDL